MRTLIKILSTLICCVGLGGDTTVIVGQKPVVAGGGSTSWMTSDPTGSTRNNFTGCVGGQFTVGGSNITVTELGLWVVSGNTETVTVKIWLNGGASVCTVNINTTGLSGWVYAPASATLNASGVYNIQRSVTNGGDLFFDIYTPSTTAVATEDHYNYDASCLGSDYPGDAGTIFAGLNFKYSSP